MTRRHPELPAGFWPDALSPLEGGDVLYTPCGAGGWLIARLDAGARVGADPVQQNLSRAREAAAIAGVSCGFVPALGWDLPFADGAFDLVVDAGSLVTAPVLDDAFVELLRVTRRGGDLLVAAGQTPNAGSIQYPRQRDLDHDALEGLAERYGAEVCAEGQRDELRWALIRR